MAEEKKKKFKDFFKNLSKREKMMSYAGAFFLLLLLMDRMILTPIVGKLRTLEGRIEHQITLIKDGLMITGYKKRIFKEYSAMKDFFDKERKTQEEELADMLREVENLAVKLGVHLVSINPSGNIEDSKLHTRYELKLECTGTMEKIMEFVYAIDSPKKLTKIETLGLLPESKKGSTEVKCTMSISRMVVAM